MSVAARMRLEDCLPNEVGVAGIFDEDDAPVGVDRDGKGSGIALEPPPPLLPLCLLSSEAEVLLEPETILAPAAKAIEGADCSERRPAEKVALDELIMFDMVDTTLVEVEVDVDKGCVGMATGIESDKVVAPDKVGKAISGEGSLLALIDGTSSAVLMSFDDTDGTS
jgi:hypothetical protein